jgi:hypothetical protein
MAEILPKVYRLIGFYVLFLPKRFHVEHSPFKFNASNLENVPYGTYQNASLVNKAID